MQAVATAEPRLRLKVPAGQGMALMVLVLGQYAPAGQGCIRQGVCGGSAGGEAAAMGSATIGGKPSLLSMLWLPLPRILGMLWLPLTLPQRPSLAASCSPCMHAARPGFGTVPLGTLGRRAPSCRQRSRRRTAAGAWSQRHRSCQVGSPAMEENSRDGSPGERFRKGGATAGQPVHCVMHKSASDVLHTACPSHPALPRRPPCRSPGRSCPGRCLPGRV